MKKVIYPFLAQTSRKTWIWLIVTVQLFFIYAFHGLFSFSIEKLTAISGGYSIPDAKMYYTFTQLQKMFQAYGPQGRHMYLQLQTIDMFYPLIYSVLLASLLFLVYRSTSLQFTVLVPFAAAIFDYVENVLLHISVVSFPQMSEKVVLCAASATFVKWFLLFFALFLLFFGFIWRVILYFRIRKNS